MTPSTVQAPLPFPLSQRYVGLHRVNNSRKMLCVDGDDSAGGKAQPTLKALSSSLLVFKIDAWQL